MKKQYNRKVKNSPGFAKNEFISEISLKNFQKIYFAP